MSHSIRTSAYGLPLGGDIKYADRETLREALHHRVET